MRFMMMMKGDRDYEAGKPPSPALMAAVEKMTVEGMQSGVIVSTGGLLPSFAGAKLRLSGGKVTVTDGPFTEAKELIGGYAIVDVRSKAEAIELGRRFLQMHADVLGPDYEIESEVRQMFDPSDLGK